MARAEHPPRLRVAFVVQRYGVEVNGGAEVHCRQVAERMSRHWQAEVLTTCALDYITWENHFPEGATTVNGVTVRRFATARPRDIAVFDRLSEALISRPRPGLEEQEEWMRAQGPWSPDLLDYIATHRDRYDLFVFFGYLYAQSYFGLALAGARSILAPLAHDEWTIHLPMWDAAFSIPSAFIFNTEEERRFLQRRFPGANLRGPIAGVAVDRPADIQPGRFRAAHGLDGGFLLYVGRIDPSKGCAEMFDYFTRHVRETGDERTLVALGKSVMPLPDHPQIRAPGFVSEQDKWDALAACDALIAPSPYESLSIVLLEAWAVLKPAVVNGTCEVLRAQVTRANGGVAYWSGGEFSEALRFLAGSGAAYVLGRQGHDYVRRRYSWEAIEKQYLEAAALVQAAHA
jgi:glycosyltransferase involved in cell wall biosynthesis